MWRVVRFVKRVSGICAASGENCVARGGIFVVSRGICVARGGNCVTRVCGLMKKQGHGAPYILVIPGQ